jgi:hypothetical protein
MTMQIKRAQRHQARLRLGLSAPSGGGKTMSALLVAKGMVQAMLASGLINDGIEGKIGLVDTERRSASLYADVVPFDVIDLAPPYSIERYIEAIDALERTGHVVIILDQISHAWAGQGGLLEYVDTLKSSARNQISPWAKATPEQHRFVDRMLRSPSHIIATMRSKTEWVMQEVIENGQKKHKPQKVGMAPVQRDGIEYEFTTMLDLDNDTHTAVASKDRTRLFAGQNVKLDADWGERLVEWLMTGDAAQPEAEGYSTAAANATQDDDALKAAVEELTGAVESAQQKFAQCATLPDLAAAYDSAVKAVKAFKRRGVQAPLVSGMLNTLAESKDERKAALSAPPPAVGGPTVVTEREPAAHDPSLPPAEESKVQVQAPPPPPQPTTINVVDEKKRVLFTVPLPLPANMDVGYIFARDFDRWRVIETADDYLMVKQQVAIQYCTPKDIKMLRTLIGGARIGEADVCKELNVPDLEHLPSAQYRAAMEAISTISKRKGGGA